jgi:hypothetical protein
MPDLIFDAATCPGADKCIALARAHSAAGWMAYIHDSYLSAGNGGWTPAVVQALLDAGLKVLPVYLKKDGEWEAVDHALEVMAAYGLQGAVMIDVERGADPGVAYTEQWCDVVAGAGHLPVVYGTATTVSTYANHARGIAVALYPPWRSLDNRLCMGSAIMPGLDPRNLPSFSTSWFADSRLWQYADSFDVDGVEVDASCSNLPLISKSQPDPAPGGDDLQPDERAALFAIYDRVNFAPAPGWHAGASPGNPANPAFPGAASSWWWRWRAWYRGAHPELNLPADPQTGAAPDQAGYSGPTAPADSWEWQERLEGDPLATLVAVKTELDAIKAGNPDPATAAAVARIEAALKQA